MKKIFLLQTSQKGVRINKVDIDWKKIDYHPLIPDLNYRIYPQIWGYYFVSFTYIEKSESKIINNAIQQQFGKSPKFFPQISLCVHPIFQEQPNQTIWGLTKIFKNHLNEKLNK